MKEPKVEVGILFEPQIEFILLAPYHVSGKEVNGKQTVTYDEGKILWNGRQYDELVFEPLQESVAAFELLDVTIGINFHWERKEDQRFQGSLKIIVENGKLTGINVIRVEDYLTSVISSVASAKASRPAPSPPAAPAPGTSKTSRPVCSWTTFAKRANAASSAETVAGPAPFWGPKTAEAPFGPHSGLVTSQATST